MTERCETQDWVIRKRGYFYRPDRAGYTGNIYEAGRYTEQEARAEASIEPKCMSAHPAWEFLPSEEHDNNTVVCPWCGHHHSDGWEMVDFKTEEPVLSGRAAIVGRTEAD